MPVKRELWKRALTPTYCPPWPCPSCRNGTLRLAPKTFHQEETAASRRASVQDDFGPYDVRLVFVAMLGCATCKESVACSGVGELTREEVEDPLGNVSIEYPPIFWPVYFSPPMLLLDVSSKVPAAVRESLKNSFASFFSDFGAAANHVRQCAEEILTLAGVPGRNANGRFVNMESRIQTFKGNDPDNADRISALRWIGNFGSHPGTLTCEDLFNAYDILEVLLEDLYVGHVRSVAATVARINQTKQP